MEVALEEIARGNPPVAGDKTIAVWIGTTLALERPLGVTEFSGTAKGRAS